MTQLKRLGAPVFWPVHRKEDKFVVRPSPGPHSKNSIPVGVLLRDILQYADNMKDVRNILNQNFVKVNGKTIKKENFPVGFMDIVSLGEDENYRVIVENKGLALRKITDSNLRLVKVSDKKINKGSKIQLNLHNGCNMLTKDKTISSGDVLIIDNEKGVIKNVLKMKKGASVMVIKGRNRGKVGILEKIIITKGSQPNRAVIKTGSESFEMPKDFLFVVGENSPLIDIGGKDE